MTRTTAQTHASRVSKAVHGRVVYSRANPVDDVWHVYDPASGIVFVCWAGGVRVKECGVGLTHKQIAVAYAVLKTCKLVD